MADDLPALTLVPKSTPKKRGRKPGSPKVPGSGRPPGGKNKVARDLREVILTRGKPLELLCDISRGVKIRVGPQAGPGEPQYTYPTMQERAAAARILVDKLIPAAAAALPQGDKDAAPPMLDSELARLTTFLLTKATREADGPSIPPRAVDPEDARKRIEFERQEQLRREEALAQVAAREAADEAAGVHWVGGRKIVPGWREDGARQPTPRVITKRSQHNGNGRRN